MSYGSIYHNVEGEAAMLRFYDEQLRRLPFPWESQMVETHFGATHVVIAGDKSKPPLVALHGALAAGALNLDFYAPLLKHFCIYSPDEPGQPGHTAPIQLSPCHHEYAGWLVEVLDVLEIDRAAFAGISFGGGILFDLAAYAPERIAQAVFIVPAGLVISQPLKIMAAFLPWMFYRIAPSPEHMRRIFRPFGDNPDDRLMQQFDLAIRHLETMHSQPPGPFSADDLRDFTAPALVILADKDVFIPVDDAARRARAVIPNLRNLVILHSKHTPDTPTTLQINQIVLEFLRAAAQVATQAPAPVHSL